jgi:hypothetical protein
MGEEVIMRLRYYLGTFLIIMFLFISLPEAWAGRVLYDDFSGEIIDNSKWLGSEAVLQTHSFGMLISKIRNTPEDGSKALPVYFQEPEYINSIECKVKVVKADLDTGYGASSIAGIEGYFYNSILPEEESEDTSNNGNVAAAIYIGNRGNGPEAFWTVREVTEEGIQERGSGTLIGPGVLELNKDYSVVKISYDGENSFEFTIDNVTDSFTGPERQREAIEPYKYLITAVNSSGGSGTGYMSVLFDEVYINDSSTVYDTFDTIPPMLDLTKWQNVEERLEVSDGKLCMDVQASGSTVTTENRLKERPDYLEAKINIKGTSWVSEGAMGRARIVGWYYNESHGPGSGYYYDKYYGNVLARNWIVFDSDKNLKAAVSVTRYNSSDYSSYTELFHKEFNTPIEFNTDYILSIEFTGSSLIFTCNDESARYQISSDVYEPYNKSRWLESRVDADSGKSGYIMARFDDVYTGDSEGESEITFTTPANNAVDVNVDESISATFRRALDRTTVTTETFLVHDGAINIDGVVKSVGNVATFKPLSPLDHDTKHTATITEGVKDFGGNSINHSYTWSFTTESGSGGNGGCFIATAAYGSPMAKDVVLLQEFRDNILTNNSVGKMFVRFYYKFSPPIANYIGGSEGLRFVVRCSLVPFVYGVKYPKTFVFALILTIIAITWKINRGRLGALDNEVKRE